MDDVVKYPKPVTNPETAHFWEQTAKGKLMSGGVRPRRPWFSHNEALEQQFTLQQ